jgi:hypothetical protein
MKKVSTAVAKTASSVGERRSVRALHNSSRLTVTAAA